MARPKAKPEDKRSVQILIRLTPSEARSLEGVISRVGEVRTEVVRKALFKGLRAIDRSIPKKVEA